MFNHYLIFPCQLPGGYKVNDIVYSKILDANSGTASGTQGRVLGPAHGVDLVLCEFAGVQISYNIAYLSKTVIGYDFVASQRSNDTVRVCGRQRHNNLCLTFSCVLILQNQKVKHSVDVTQGSPKQPGQSNEKQLKTSTPKQQNVPPGAKSPGSGKVSKPGGVILTPGSFIRVHVYHPQTDLTHSHL